MNVAELLLRITGDSSGAVEAAAEADAALASVGDSADTTRGKLDETSSSSERTGAAFRDTARDTENLGRSIDDTNAKHQSFVGTLGSVVSWLTGTRKVAEDLGGTLGTDLARKSEDAAKGVDDAGKAAKDGVSGFEKLTTGVDAAGKVLTLLGVAGGAGQQGLGGVVSAADGAVTGLSTFTPAVSGAQRMMSVFGAASSALTGVLVGIGVVLSPLIASLASFAVGLAGAVAVMGLALGGVGALAAGVVVLANATGQINGPMQTFKNAWQGVADTLGKQVAPQAALVLRWLTGWAPMLQQIGSAAANYLGGVLGPVLSIASVLVRELLGALRQLGTAFAGVVSNFTSHGADFEALFGMILRVGVGAVSGLLTNLTKLSNWFFQTLPTFEPLVRDVFGVIGTVLMGAVQFVGRFGLAFAGLFDALRGGQQPTSAMTSALEQLGVPAQAAATATSAIAGAIQILRTVLGGAVAVLEPFARSFATTFASAYSGGGQTFDKIAQALQRFLDVLRQAAPALGQIAGTILSANLLPWLEKMAPTVIDLATNILSRLVPAIRTFADLLQRAYPILIALGIAFAGFKFVAFIQGALAGAEGMAAFLVRIIAVTVSQGPAAAATGVWTMAQDALNASMFANPIGLIILGIAALIAVVILVVTHWKQVSAVLDEVWGKIRQFASWIGGEFVQAWTAAISAVGQFFSSLGTRVHQGLTTIFNELKALASQWWPLLLLVLPGGALVALIVLIVQHWSQVRQLFTQAFNVVRGLVSGFWAWAMGLWQGALEFVHNLLLSFVNREIQGWLNIFNWLRTTASDFWNWGRNLFQAAYEFVHALLLNWINREIQGWLNIFDWIRSTASGFWDWIRGTWQAAFDWVHNLILGEFDKWRAGFQTVFDDIRSKVTSWISDLQGMFTGLATNLAATLGGIASDIGSKLHDGLNTALGFIDTFDKDVNDLVGKVGVTLTLPTDLKLAAGGVVAAFAAGGMVLAALGGTLPGYAPGQDTVHALLSPGEGVLTPQATRGIGGGPAINAINAAFAAGGVVNSAAQALSGPLRLPAFAGGGIVGSVGGECVVFVEQQEGHHFPVEYANQMTQYINSHTPAVGEIFVSTISPDGHTGIINGPNSVIDSNWNLDGVVHVHPLSDIPDIAGYINLGQPLPAGLPGGNGGPGGAAALLSSLLSGPEGALKSAVSGVGGIAGQLAGGVVQKMIDGVNSLGGSSSGASYSGGGDVGAWITAGLLAAGKPLSWLGDMETIAHYESSDNPNANQGLNGSANALGLMQTIQSTFNAYVPAALKALGIFNPEANAAASANYIASRYGDPSRTPGILSLAAGGPYRGYANGGIAVTPQIATLAEKGPEMVSPYRPGGGSFADVVAEQQKTNTLLEQIAEPQSSPVNSLSAQLRHPH